jgi:hypothetical protein
MTNQTPNRKGSNPPPPRHPGNDRSGFNVNRPAPTNIKPPPPPNPPNPKK